jgi:glutaminyl-tRNA synthetase
MRFGRELWIENDDFREEAPKKYFRLTPGQEVRLRYAYYVTCTGVVKDAEGNIKEVHCTYDPESKGGSTADGRKVKGTIHWVSACDAVPAEVRLYEPLFVKENPNQVEEGKTFLDYLNPESEKVVTAYLEPRLAEFEAGTRVQFERLGYFCVDKDSKPGKPVFNRTATLRDSWARVERNQK